MKAIQLSAALSWHAGYPHHIFILIFLMEYKFSAVFFKKYEDKNLYAIMKSQ